MASPNGVQSRCGGCTAAEHESVIVNGREYGVRGLADSRGELSDYTDTAKYRQHSHSFDLHGPHAPPQPLTPAPGTLPGSAKWDPPKDNCAPGCASNELEGQILSYCWDSLGALLDIEHEIEIVDTLDDDDDSDAEQVQAWANLDALGPIVDENPKPVPALRIVGGLSVVSDKPDYVEPIPGGVDIQIPAWEAKGGGEKAIAFGQGQGAPIGKGWIQIPDTQKALIVVPPGCTAADADPVDNPKYTDQNFRWSKSGVGHCSSVNSIRRAFRFAYQVIRAADEELTWWFEKHPSIAEAKAFWRYSSAAEGYDDRCTLAYWFGDPDAEKFGDRFGEVYNTIRSWSLRFRHGFYGFHQPVYFRCRSDKDNGQLGIHASLNVITLYKAWWDVDNVGERGLSILHEMGHLSRSGLQWVIPGLFGMGVGTGIMLTSGPRDRRNSVCQGGKCYENEIGGGTAAYGLLAGPNPRALVTKFEKGGSGSDAARRDMLDNIDNYVCWMWNRWRDRGYCRIEAS